MDDIREALAVMAEQRRINNVAQQEHIRELETRLAEAERERGALEKEVGALRVVLEALVKEREARHDYMIAVMNTDTALADAGYGESQSQALEESLSLDPVASVILALDLPWQGTPTELYEQLTVHAPGTVWSIQRSWPKSPQALSAHLKRIAPALRQVGIDILWERTSLCRTIRIQKVEDGA